MISHAHLFISEGLGGARLRPFRARRPVRFRPGAARTCPWLISCATPWRLTNVMSGAGSPESSSPALEFHLVNRLGEFAY